MERQFRQITSHTPANAPDDIIFIGLGEAVPDSSFYNEPRNSLNFRIHRGATAFGTFTAQIRKTGRQATFEILDAGIAATIPDIGTAGPFLYTSGSRIFFGNASGAYSFDGPLVIAGA